MRRYYPRRRMNGVSESCDWLQLLTEWSWWLAPMRHGELPEEIGWVELDIHSHNQTGFTWSFCQNIKHNKALLPILTSLGGVILDQPQNQAFIIRDATVSSYDGSKSFQCDILVDTGCLCTQLRLPLLSILPTNPSTQQFYWDHQGLGLLDLVCSYMKSY